VAQDILMSVKDFELLSLSNLVVVLQALCVDRELSYEFKDESTDISKLNIFFVGEARQ